MDLPNPGTEPGSPALQVDSLPAEPQGKPKNTGVGSLSLLHWIFLTQKLNQGLLHYRQILYQLSYEGSFTCNVGDPGSIPGLGRSTGEGISYPLQYSWASLMAQLVKNPPTMWEAWVRSLGWEVLLEKGMATYSSILDCRIPWT